MRRAISLLLATSLLSLSLAGCGAPATMPAGEAMPERMQAQVARANATELAREFASAVEARTGRRPEVRGAVVALTTADQGAATYDFSRTPATGRVAFRAGEVETTFEYAPREGPNGEAVPAILVAVAVKMVWGGSKALLRYWLTHRGDEFNKKDCAKAVVFGMVAEGLTAIPVVGGVLSHLLWPIAWKWVEKWLDKNLPWDIRRLMALGLEFTGEISGALQEAIAQSQQ